MSLVKILEPIIETTMPKIIFIFLYQSLILLLLNPFLKAFRLNLNRQLILGKVLKDFFSAF